VRAARRAADHTRWRAPSSTETTRTARVIPACRRVVDYHRLPRRHRLAALEL